MRYRLKRIDFKLNGNKTVLIVLMYSLICPFFFQDSNIFKFAFDLFLVVLSFFIIVKRYKIKVSLQVLIGIVYVLICCISALLNSTPYIKFWWNSRSSFSCIIYIIACQLFLTNKSVEYIKDLFLKLNHINFFLVIIEFILGYKQDILGGMFGHFVGCNALLNVFMVIVTIIATVKFQQSKLALTSFSIVLVENCIIAALAELKIYFVELVIIYCLVILLSRFTLRTIMAILCGIVIAYAGIMALYQYNPYFRGFFNIDNMLESFDLAYADNNGLSRGRAIEYISKHFLNTKNKLYFGIGFGNANFSNVSLLSSEFYQSYSFLKYNWFCHSYKFLETGYLGMISFIAMWISPIFAVNNKAPEENIMIAKTTAILCAMLFVYNTSLMNLYTMFVLLFFTSLVYIDKE